MLVGFFGLTSTKFTPYHEVVVGKDWTMIEPSIQSILLAMQKIEGGGFMATGLAILFLLIPLRQRKTWGLIALPIIVAANWLPTLYSAMWLKSLFPSAPTPVAPTIIFISVVAFGLGLFFLEHRKAGNQ